MKNFLTNISENASRLVSKAKFKLKKVSPEILIVGGVVCVVGATVMACKATKKAEEKMDDALDEIDVIKDKATVTTHDEEGNSIDVTTLTKEDKHDILMIKARAIGEMARVYAPAAALGAAGIAMIFTSHGIMKKRNGALLASYNALDAAFKSYRQRVLEEEDGRDRDRRYLLGERKPVQSGPVELSEDEFEQLMSEEDVENVNRQGMKEARTAALGPYVFYFDQFSSPYFSAHAMSNLNRIRAAEEWGNRQLRYNGHLFLNDILKELGMDPVPWGQLVGWMRGNQDGDSYVEIIADDQRAALACDNDTACKPIYLEFNCDGLIWSRI